MADFHNHEPLTRADLAGLSQAVLRATAAHREEYQANLVQARAEIRSEARNLGQTLRDELSHLGQDLLVRVGGTTRRLETIVDERDNRLIAVLLSTQLAVVVILTATFRLLAP
jgi:hypothetical protein